MGIRLSDKFTEHFQAVWGIVKSGQYLKHVFKGGRGSAKSTHIAMFIILLMQLLPITFLCVRKVGNTLSESCFEQLKEAIDILGVGQYWHINVSPLKLTYKPRGNKIIFRGADDPQKIKSIKVSKFPLAGLWIEELAEFKSEKEVSMIEKSVLRGILPDGMRYMFFYSYNPPEKKQSWVNKLYNTQVALAKNVFVHHSTYLQNPYVSQDFIDEAEETKLKPPFNEKGISLKWLWEYMGEAIGSGVTPFENLTFRTITDEEIATFDNYRNGNDWGYGNDPLSFVRWHYDKTRKRIYAVAEKYGVKIHNKELAEWILAKDFNDVQTTCDSSEPKSVDEVKLYGIKAKGAKKGPGSVEYGEKWLDGLDEIIIDAKRTPNIAKEFEDIDYATDAQGNPKTRLEDENNHTIDATRYAFEGDMKHKRSLGEAKAI